MSYLNLTSLSPGSRQPYVVTPERERPRSRPKSLWCDVALIEATHARCQTSRWGDAPHLPVLQVPPLLVRRELLDQSLSAWLPELPYIIASKIPVDLGGSPNGHPKADLHALRCAWASSTSSGVAWRRPPTGWCVIRVCSPMAYSHFGAPGF